MAALRAALIAGEESGPAGPEFVLCWPVDRAKPFPHSDPTTCPTADWAARLQRATRLLCAVRAMSAARSRAGQHPHWP